MAAVRYLVKDVPEAIRFYVDLLGFKLVRQYGPAMAILQRDQLELWVAGPTSSAAQPMPDGSHPSPGGWSRIVIVVEDLSGVVARLKGRGTRFRNDILQGPGGSQVLCEDPSGNPIELFEP
jgi:catechol 2,3-dioxygenase-like lactoylglutathione lyase family enzyme